jgi:hypothetical protein
VPLHGTTSGVRAVLDLDPRCLPSGTVRCIEVFRDDTLLIVPGDLEKKRFAMGGDVLSNLKPCTPRQVSEQPLVLNRAKPVERDPRGFRRSIVIATARDGYKAIFSWAELIDMFGLFNRERILGRGGIDEKDRLFAAVHEWRHIRAARVPQYRICEEFSWISRACSHHESSSTSSGRVVKA